MRKGYIYVITNKVNNKQYVGKTVQEPKKYWKWHKNNVRKDKLNTKVLYRAMNKYGISQFEFEVIEEVYVKEIKLNDKLNYLEKYYIKEFGTFKEGYNMTLGGDGNFGVKRSEEFKRNLSKIKTGVPRPEWVKEKMRKPKSPEHIQKMKKPKTQEHKDSLRKSWEKKTGEEVEEINKKIRENRRSYKGELNPFYGKKHTEEVKHIIANKARNHQNKPEVKLKNKTDQKTRIELYAVDNEDKKAYKFLSIGDATKWVRLNTKFKGDKGTISKASKYNKKSYGYIWYRSLRGVETIERVIDMSNYLL